MDSVADAPDRFAPEKSDPENVDCAKVTLVKFACEKLLPLAVTFVNDELAKLAPEKFEPSMVTSVKVREERSQPERSRPARTVLLTALGSPQSLLPDDAPPPVEACDEAVPSWVTVAVTVGPVVEVPELQAPNAAIDIATPVAPIRYLMALLLPY